MKDLRELCRILNSRLLDHRRLIEGGYPVPTDRISIIESFALQIRNEALEEAKEAVSKPVPGVTSEHAVTLMHACERITALAAGRQTNLNEGESG